jgi:hypothetical protein
MQRHFKPEDLMTIEEFLAFTASRPDDERWELIEGRPKMQASATDVHQIITGNIFAILREEKRGRNARWHPLLGIGTRVPVSPRSLPQPDVMVKERSPTGAYVSDGGLVLFEVMSRSNTKADRRWRLGVYKSVPNCQHYVTVEQTRVHVDCYDRTNGWQLRTIKDVGGALELPAVGVSMPLAEIYWDTPLARRSRR